MKHLQRSDTNRSNARLTSVSPRRKSTHSANWLILLARHGNNNNMVNMINMISIRIRNLNQLAQPVINFLQQTELHLICCSSPRSASATASYFTVFSRFMICTGMPFSKDQANFSCFVFEYKFALHNSLFNNKIISFLGNDSINKLRFVKSFIAFKRLIKVNLSFHYIRLLVSKIYYNMRFFGLAINYIHTLCYAKMKLLITFYQPS